MENLVNGVWDVTKQEAAVAAVDYLTKNYLVNQVGWGDPTALVLDFATSASLFYFSDGRRLFFCDDGFATNFF